MQRVSTQLTQEEIQRITKESQPAAILNVGTSTDSEFITKRYIALQHRARNTPELAQNQVLLKQILSKITEAYITLITKISPVKSFAELALEVKLEEESKLPKDTPKAQQETLQQIQKHTPTYLEIVFDYYNSLNQKHGGNPATAYRMLELSPNRLQEQTVKQRYNAILDAVNSIALTNPGLPVTQNIGKILLNALLSTLKFIAPGQPTQPTAPVTQPVTPGQLVQQTTGGLNNDEASRILNASTIEALVNVAPGADIPQYVKSYNDLLQRFNQTSFIRPQDRENALKRLGIAGQIITNILRQELGQITTTIQTTLPEIGSEEYAKIAQAYRDIPAFLEEQQNILNKAFDEYMKKRSAQPSTPVIQPGPIVQPGQTVTIPEQPVTTAGAQEPERVIKRILDYQRDIQQLQSQIQEVSRPPITTEKLKKKEDLMRRLQILQKTTPQELLNQAFGTTNIYKRVRAADLKNLETITAFARQMNLTPEQLTIVLSMLGELQKQVGVNEGELQKQKQAQQQQQS